MLSSLRRCFAIFFLEHSLRTIVQKISIALLHPPLPAGNHIPYTAFPPAPRIRYGRLVCSLRGKNQDWYLQQVIYSLSMYLFVE